LDHKPYSKPLTRAEKTRLEIEYKRGLAMCSGRTLEKNLRKVGVLDGEVATIDLSRKPSFDLGLVEGLTQDSMKLDKVMERSVKNILFFILDEDYTQSFKNIDCNGDGSLSGSEINDWFCRNRLKTNDQVAIRKWRNIIVLCLKIIDNDNNG